MAVIIKGSTRNKFKPVEINCSIIAARTMPESFPKPPLGLTPPQKTC
jgi:hypothetical protein